MRIAALTGTSRWISVLSIGLLWSACSTLPPVSQTPPRYTPPPPPAVQKIPGTPVTLSPKEQALSSFLKSHVALTRGDYDTALEALAEAVERDPDTSFIRFRLATLYVRMGQPDIALEHCRIVAQQEPDNLEAQMFLAGLLSSTGREDEAAAIYEGVLAKEPDQQEPYLYLGTLYAQTKEIRKSERCLI